MLDIFFEPDKALPLMERLFEDDLVTYDRIYDTLEAIAADPEEAKVRLSEYVSTRRVWGTHVRRTEYTVFWDTDDSRLLVVFVLREL